MSNRKRRVKEELPAGSVGLVLFRRPGERIVLAGGVTITLVRTRNGGAEIGIKAPSTIGISREETIRKEK